MLSLTKIAQATSGLTSEIQGLRNLAKERITNREIARSFINKHVPDMPVLCEGEHAVTFLDERKQASVKMQDKNLSLWVVALQTTIETGYTSYALLGSIFSSWAKDTLNVDWDIKTAKNVAKMYINTMQSTAILSGKLEKTKYIHPDTNEETESLVVKLSDKFREMMLVEEEELRESAELICKPLSNKPENWTSNIDGIHADSNIQLINGKLFAGDEIAQPVLDAVNKLQAVKFRVAPCIIDAAYDILDNQHEYNSSDEDMRMFKEILQFENKEVYFMVTMDKRGRMYYRGGLLSPQGTDFCKAAFQFAEGKVLGENGIKAVALHTANVLGQDKLSINDRVKWVDDNMALLMLGINDHHDVREHFPKADVFQATVAIMEIQAIMQLPEDDRINFVSHLVCHQDGTCNGLQHMAAITKNRQTAISVNCVASTHDDKPSDMYGIIASYAGDIKGIEDSAHNLIVKYGRSMAKNPVMITGYGAGEATIIGNTAKYLIEHNEDAQWGEAVGEAYLAAIEANAGAVKSLTNALKSRVQKAVENGATKFTWTTNDGFVASTEYRDVEPNRIRAGVFNALVKDLFKPELDVIKTVGAMSPNFIHSIDSTHVRQVTVKCDHSLVLVHDSVGSHAATYFDTARVIREEFVAVHEYAALDNLCSNMGMRTPKFRGDFDVSEVLQSSYIFS